MYGEAILLIDLLKRASIGHKGESPFQVPLNAPSLPSKRALPRRSKLYRNLPVGRLLYCTVL